MRKTLCLLLVAAFLLGGIAACGNDEDDIVEISFFHWKGEEKDVWDEVIEMFQDQNPNIRVHMEILPEEQYYTTLHARVLAGEGLDVFMVNPGSRFASFLLVDAFYDLTGQPFLNDLIPSFLDSGQSDGRQYIVPLSKSFVGLFYNQRIMRELGLQTPTTWEDFLAVCQAIQDAGYEVISTGMADAFTSTWPFAALVVQYSEDLDIYGKLARGEMAFTDPLFRSILEPVIELAHRGFWLSDASGTMYDTSIALFATERTAMHNNGTWAIGAIRQANPDLEFSIMLYPSPGGQHIAGVAPAQAVSVFRETQNLDESLKFMEFILSKEVMELYGNQTGQEVPNRNAVLTDPDLAAMAPIGAVGSIYPHYFSEWAQIDQGIIGEITSRAIMGEDLDVILQDAQARLELLDLDT